jgi:hypothetical protein
VTPSLSSPSSPALTAAASPFISPATEKGAYDFVKAYFAERDRTASSGDLSRLIPYRTGSCSCVDIEKKIATRPSDGSKIYSQHLMITKWYFEWRGPTAAKAVIWTTARDVFGKVGESPTVRNGSGYFVLDLKRDFTRWVLADLRLKQTS